MINSLSNKHKVIANSPNYLIFSTAIRNSKSSSGNQSTQEVFPSASSDRNQNNQSQPRTFKIRTFANKIHSGKQPKIEGKRITQEAIKCIKEESELRILNSSYAYRRPSIQLNKEKTHNQNILKRKRQFVPAESAIFKEIQLLKKPEKHALNFKMVDFSEFGTLSHKPHIWFNPERPSSQKEHEFVLIISSNFINLEPKRMPKQRERSYHSYRSTDTNISAEIPAQSQNILRNICGSQQNFLRQCKIYFKVNSQSQLGDLRQYLYDNDLLNFDGIINIRPKCTDTHNFYNLREIVSKDQKLIILQQQQTLKSQIPLIQGLDSMFISLTGKNLTQLTIGRVINLLKEIEVQTQRGRINISDSLQKQALLFHDEKQNLHPNIQLIKTMSCNKQTKNMTSNKKKHRNKSILFVNIGLKMKQVNLDGEILTSKLAQQLEAKKIKNSVRQNRSLSKKNIPASSSSVQKQEKQKPNRNRSINNRSLERDICKQPNFLIQLEGDFKQKMIKYVKILDNERSSMAHSKQSNPFRQKPDSKNDDDLEELTFNLTSRTKSKTPFQLVGDLLRGNAHIARQISKYINHTRPLRKLIDQRQLSLNQCREGLNYSLTLNTL